MGQTIITQPPPNISKEPNVQLNKGSLDAFIHLKGYDVYHEKAIPCPCKVEGQDNLSSCRNCLGTGWVFLNKVKTRMLVHSMNLQTKYKEWSREILGTASITARDVDKLSYMDRITLLNTDTLHSQIIHPAIYQNKYFAYLDYPLIKVESVFMFIDPDRPLVKLEENVDFNINSSVFSLNYSKYYQKPNITISISYHHSVAFHIIDLTRDILTMEIRNDISGIKEWKDLPIAAVGRKAHLVLGLDNYKGDLLIDNSFKENLNCKI